MATPGRLAQLVERRVVRLGRLSCLVLDEADRLMDLGLWPDLRVLVRRHGGACGACVGRVCGGGMRMEACGSMW